MARCRSCEAPVVWAETRDGKKMCLDAAPDPRGKLVLVAGEVRSATEDDKRLHRDTYTSHFATCPDADYWRKAR